MQLCYTLGVETEVAIPATLIQIFLIHCSLIPPNNRFICLFKQFTHFPRVVPTLNRTWILGPLHLILVVPCYGSTL